MAQSFLDGPELSVFAQRHLERRGIDVRLETTVAALDAGQVTLADGETLAAETVIWCAGIEPNPALRAIEVPVDERGYVLCERDLRVRSFDNVWAIGDGAVNIDAHGNAYPATAQHAVRQAEDVARNIRRVLDGEAPKEHVFRAQIVRDGDREALALDAGEPVFEILRTTWMKEAVTSLAWEVLRSSRVTC